MPIISTVGRKAKKMRALISALYVLLTLGALTMVYPFLLMVSTSFTSYVDQDEFRPVPRYFYNDEVLFRKYVEAKYNEDIVRYDQWFGKEYGTFREVNPPSGVNMKFVREWQTFKSGMPRTYMVLASCYSPSASKITPELVGRYRNFVRLKFNGDLMRMNVGYKEADESWMELGMPTEEWSERDFKIDPSDKFDDYLKYKNSLPQRYLLTIAVDGLYQDSLKLRLGALKAINKELGLNPPARDLADVHLTPRIPNGRGAYAWEQFVRKDCPVRFVHIDDSASSAYQSFIRSKYVNTHAYNHAYKASISAWNDLRVPSIAPASGVKLVDWVEFLQSAVPITDVEVISPDVLFRSHLQHTYATVQRMNRSLGTHFLSFQAVAPPYLESDWIELKENRRAIRHEFMVRNYREVIEYIALHGRALVNTAILCLGIVLATLTVNPLCAYALSRYNLRSTYKILLFLLATMAFPAEVSAIPSFLLIKKLHILGTYWAIILPSLANGYSVFLLKGFFDSLPQELFEAAHLDGATEMQMYWKICIQLSKPVLAVIGLGAFTMAYGSFMWAFLVCQNPKMWTLMVWLYQMQIWAPQYLVYAGLVLAAIPTLLVFIFCQNIIMRGIIIPSEK